MTITNGYATLTEFKERFFPVGIADDAENPIYEAVIEAVSRLIDNYCSRYFYKNSTAEIRYFTAQDGSVCVVTDLVSITTLYTDENEDRLYSTTWGSTDYELYPYNAALDGVPYAEILLAPDGNYDFPTSERGVKINGIFGWPGVPKPVKEACLLQTARLVRRKDAPFGVTGSAEMGQLQVIPRLDPDVRLLLEPYRIVRV